MEEHSQRQRQGHLSESRVVISGNHVGNGEGREGIKCSSQEAQTYKESRQPKCLYYQGRSSPGPWAGELEGQVYYTGRRCIMKELRDARRT